MHGHSKVKVWGGVGIQPSIASQLDQRELDLTSLCLAMTYGYPATFLTCFGLPDNQTAALGLYPAVSSKSFYAPPESPESLTA